MHISEKYKFVFIDIPKTASLTLDTVFENRYDAKLSKPPRNSKLGEKHSRIIPEWASTFTKVTCVRNPFERICSFYHFVDGQLVNPRNPKLGTLFNFYGIKTFDDFIDKSIEYTQLCPDNEVNGFQYRLFPAWKYLAPMGYDIVLKQEKLLEDFKKLPFVDKQESLPRKNSNKTNVGWGEVYTTERRDKIIEWAGKDFELFGYDKNYKGNKK